MSPLEVLKSIQDSAYRTMWGNFAIPEAVFLQVKEALNQRPDYAYNPHDWECTYHKDQFGELDEELEVRIGDIKEIGTLYEGPKMFAAVKVLSWDDAGDVDDYEIEWFPSREAAEAAVEAQKKRMTQQEVIDALNTAAANGYDMSLHSPDDIVADLLAFEAQAEQDTAENLLPHVNAWLALKSKSA